MIWVHNYAGAALDCTSRSIALAKPSFSFVSVTNVADFCTSGLAFPMAMLTPLLLNIRTSLGMSPKVAISLMAQYYPIHRAASGEKYAALNRSITAAEWAQALSALELNGMEAGFQQELETANKYYRPDFRDKATPFRDIRDFQAT